MLIVKTSIWEYFAGRGTSLNGGQFVNIQQNKNLYFNHFWIPLLEIYPTDTLVHVHMPFH